MEKDDGNIVQMLSETLRISKENNQLLKAMRRDALIGAVLKVLFWGVLIGGSLYFSLHYLEPLLTPAKEGQADGLKMLIDLYGGQLPAF